MAPRSRKKTASSSSSSASKSSKASFSPLGIFLDGGAGTKKRNRRGRWRVGPEIGSGAQGHVHEIVLSKYDRGGGFDDGGDDDDQDASRLSPYAAKLAPIPIKTTKKGTSVAEINVNSIYKEYVLYLNHFVSLCGDVLPALPLSSSPSSGAEMPPPPPVYGDVDGFRYLVMERMESSLTEFVKSLREIASSSSNKALPTTTARGRRCRGSSSSSSVVFVDVGPLASRLLHIVRSIHDLRHVVVDVKMDNFMFRPPSTSSSKKSKSRASSATVSAPDRFVGEMSERLCAIDLGLLQSYLGPTGHRPNNQLSGTVGTPLYMSLNVHGHQTPSRRDDVEAVLYLVVDLILRLSSGNHHNDQDQDASSLPWGKRQARELTGSACPRTPV